MSAQDPSKPVADPRLGGELSQTEGRYFGVCFFVWDLRSFVALAEVFADSGV
jgi:hypothetical protein